MVQIFSRQTLEKFEAASASIPIRRLDRAFEAAGIRLGKDPGGPEGSRRAQFRRYLASVDQRDARQLQQLGDALGTLIEEAATSKQEFLVKAAQSDGFVFDGGVFRPRSLPAELDLAHLNLDVRDLDASQRFYGELLGLPVQRFDRVLRIDHAGSRIVLWVGEPQVGGSFHFGFRVARTEDVDAWIARLRSHGVPVLIEPKRTGAVYGARVADPSGYAVEIYADL